MKIQVRKNMFETNSSSCHSLCICTEEEYTAWEEGRLIYDDNNSKFVPAVPGMNDEYPKKYPRYLTVEAYKKFYDKEIGYPKQTLYKERKINGVPIIAFGWTGEWH